MRNAWMHRFGMETVFLLLTVAGASAAIAVEVPRILAHRGGRLEYDDNAVGGFVRSLAAGVTGFETDVRLTSDNELVVMHDSTVDRTAIGTGAIETMTLAEATNLTLRVSGEKVPPLQAILNVLKGRSDIFIELEMKTDSSTYYTDARLTTYCAKLYAAATTTLEAGTFVFTSFNVSALTRMKRVAPEARTRYILSTALTENAINSAISIGASGIAPLYTGTTASLIAEAHAAGLTVAGWMVESLETYMTARERGFDTITSDHPVTLLDLVNEISENAGTVILWTGKNGSIWDTAVENWKIDGTAGRFKNGMRVVFDDTASIRTVTLTNSVYASGIVFTNNNDYILNGSGAIQ